MPPMYTQKRLLTGFLVSFTAVIIILLADHYAALNLPVLLLIPLRWLPILIFMVYAVKKKSLTTWIFFSMLAGIEFGYDLPAVAKEMLSTYEWILHDGVPPICLQVQTPKNVHA